MHVTPIKTHALTKKDTDIFAVIDKYIVDLQNNTVVVVTSKIVAICEGRIVPLDKITKDELVQQEAEYYLPRTYSKYDVCISIKNSLMVASAGIDESNANDNFVLWPKKPQQSANSIRGHLTKRFGLKHIGVIITDSKTTPLRWGVTGIAVAHSGFNALNSYVGKPDIFGRPMRVEKLNVADSLATSAVAVMGEGNEQTPLALITDVPFVEFRDSNPTQEELDMLKIAIEDDIYAPLLTSVKWKKGKIS